MNSMNGTLLVGVVAFAVQLFFFIRWLYRRTRDLEIYHYLDTIYVDCCWDKVYMCNGFAPRSPWRAPGNRPMRRTSHADHLRKHRQLCRLL